MGILSKLLASALRPAASLLYMVYDAAPPAPVNGETRPLASGPNGGLLVEGASRQLTDAGPWAYMDPVTPADTDLPDAPARGLHVITSGTVIVQVLSRDGVTRNNLTYTYAASGFQPQILPGGIYQVKVGTTATVVAGL